MKGRRRGRTLVLLLTTAIAGAIALSARWELSWRSEGPIVMWVGDGVVGLNIVFYPLDEGLETGVRLRDGGWKNAWGGLEWWPDGEFFPRRYKYIAVVVPLWMFIPLVLAIRVMSVIRARRARAGHCRACGYDLTGVTSGRCPECGCSRADSLKAES
jgi:hypothetical protein